jgi:Trypsin
MMLPRCLQSATAADTPRSRGRVGPGSPKEPSGAAAARWLEGWMIRSFARLLCGALVIAATLVVVPARVGAIVYGFVDTNNVFRNTGAFIVKSPTTGFIYPICSGSLISATAFLTASHCTLFFEFDLAPLGYTAFVSFDNPIPFGDLTTSSTGLVPVTQVVTNPNYNQSQGDSGDIAVLIVQERHTRGITPASLPTSGLLDQLVAQNGLQNTVFTPVGYGLQNRVVGGGPPSFQDRNPAPRMYAFSSFDALNKTYLRLSQNASTGSGGTCFGDSGGPNFFNYNGVRLLAAITITGDSTTAREFLSPYVTLP